MNHLHTNRNHGSEISMIKQTVQYKFFLVVCIWLLYQIHHSIYVRRDSNCDFTETGFTDERIAKVLSRKGGAKDDTSHYTEEVDLYGVYLTNSDDDQLNKPNSEGNIEEFVSEMVDKKGNFSMSENRVKEDEEEEEDRKREVSQENDRESEVRMNGVIMEKGENLETFKFSDENGVPKAEFEPSMRSASMAGNQTEQMEEFRDVCHQNVTDEKHEKLE